jgi:uncharacterized spore protein YtfJ
MAKRPETATDTGEMVPGMSLEMTHEVLSQMLDQAGPQTAFGRPIKRDEVTVIPAAEVISVAGVGSALGNWTADEADEEAVGFGEGSGGGGKTFSRPVAVVVISGDDVRVEPVFDLTKVFLAAITAAGFMLATLFRMRATLRRMGR